MVRHVVDTGVEWANLPGVGRAAVAMPGARPIVLRLLAEPARHEESWIRGACRTHTSAWLTNSRRPRARNHEALPATSEAMIRWSMVTRSTHHQP